LAVTLHTLPTSCRDAPPPGCQPQITGPTCLQRTLQCVYPMYEDCIFCSLLAATNVYALALPPCLCATESLTCHTPPLVAPIMLSLTPLGSLSSSVFPGLRPALRPNPKPRPTPTHYPSVCAFARRVRHIKCCSKPTSVEGEWAIKPSNSESALVLT